MTKEFYIGYDDIAFGDTVESEICIGGYGELWMAISPNATQVRIDKPISDEQVELHHTEVDYETVVWPGVSLEDKEFVLSLHALLGELIKDRGW